MGGYKKVLLGGGISLKNLFLVTILLGFGK